MRTAGITKEVRMPVKSLPSSPSLKHLRHQARDLLKELQSSRPEAFVRAREFHPKFARADDPQLHQTKFTLADAQLTVAREYGFNSWPKLKEFVGAAAPPATEPSSLNTPGEVGNPEVLVARFLEYACPDHHVRGGWAHMMARDAALQLLKQHPEIARHNLYTAIVCGELEEVQRLLRQRPEAVAEKFAGPGPDRSGAGESNDLLKDIGPKRWEPLLYLCFTRLPIAAVTENAVAMARLLLEQGADPNAYFKAGDSRYTPLVGVIGEGEESRPPHPQRDALVGLLLERDAEPYDTQVIYNIHFQGDILWFMKLMYQHAVRRGRQADWVDPEWSMLNMGGYGTGARWHLEVAMKNNDLALAEWLLAHGANPNTAPARDQRFPRGTLYQESVRRGFTELAELLVRHGAQTQGVVIKPEELFLAACLRLDKTEAERLARERPECLQLPRALMFAAERDRADVAALLLDLGMSPDIADPKEGKQRALHVCAYSDSPRVATLLIARGAEIDAQETNFNAIPLGFAIWAQKPRMIDLLSPLSRNVWHLAFLGKVERLRHVLDDQPELAKALSPDGDTSLMRLPGDDALAVEIAKLLLAHGADPLIKNQQGRTAAELASKRGLDRTAELLRAQTRTESTSPHEGAPQRFESLASDLVSVYETGDAAALQRLNEFRGRSSTWDDVRADVWHSVYKVRQAKGRPGSFELADAKEFLARQAGFGNWAAFVNAGGVLPGEPYTTDGARISPRRSLSDTDWDALIAVMKERRISALDANGHMTDSALQRIADLDHVTSLDLGGSQQLTDDGLKHLAQMPQLRRLDLSNYPGSAISDRGLETLRHLRELREFEICWQPGITDTGVSNLRFCEQLESVNLLGTPTGDGSIAALVGKGNLRRFRSGKLVTDAGLPLLHQFPVFKAWQGGEMKYSLMSPDAEPNHLLLDGPFTDAGLAHLAGLNGLFGLSIFWHASATTPTGLRALADLPNLGFLGCEGTLCNDDAMRYIAAIPCLRMLMAQGAVATDAGFTALSGSQTLEYLWGRECPNLTGRGFVALSKMPSLRGIGVSCKNVDEASLGTLPRFPALRDLMPMDVNDSCFRHVGACQKLERLWCMYCRDTTDIATEHIANLKLKHYYAGLTQITDRSLELLSRMISLETIAFNECQNITGAGVRFLAHLPHLREIKLYSLPNVTLEATRVFPALVRVSYSA